MPNPVDSDKFLDLKALKELDASGAYKDQKVAIAPLKSGEPGGTLMKATLSDGTEMVNFGRGPGA